MLVGKLLERDHLGNLGRDGNFMLKHIVKYTISGNGWVYLGFSRAQYFDCGHDNINKIPIPPPR
jgi:hypothetical protein